MNGQYREVSMCAPVMATESANEGSTPHRLARCALLGFIVTFLVSRTLVFLIMSGQIPNMFLFLNGTHVHHLNYGIFLLSSIGGYLLFFRPEGKTARRAALVYGFAMGLTFDEFGMWLHLGGSYWQRASVDAVIVVAALLALVAYASTIKRFQSLHFRAFIILLIAVAGFGYAVLQAGNHIGAEMGPGLRDLESNSSP
jgi:hypothetical protein